MFRQYLGVRSACTGVCTPIVRRPAGIRTGHRVYVCESARPTLPRAWSAGGRGRRRCRLQSPGLASGPCLDGGGVLFPYPELSLFWNLLLFSLPRAASSMFLLPCFTVEQAVAGVGLWRQLRPTEGPQPPSRSSLAGRAPPQLAEGGRRVGSWPLRSWSHGLGPGSARAWVREPGRTPAPLLAAASPGLPLPAGLHLRTCSAAPSCHGGLVAVRTSFILLPTYETLLTCLIFPFRHLMQMICIRGRILTRSSVP